MLHLCYFFHVLLAIFVQPLKAQSRWPQGTVASGSTQIGGSHPWNDSFAIDGDKTTMWIDGTEGEFPDILIIAMPEPRNLSNITILSNAAGWPTHYTVENLLSNSSWATAAELSDLPSFISTATFAKPVISSQFRITVYNTSTTPGEQIHTRINEVYPIYSNETQPSLLNGSLSASQTNNRTTIIVGTVASISMVLTTILSIIAYARHRSRHGKPQIWDRLLGRKKPLNKEKTILEVSNDVLRAELDNLYETMRREISEAFKARMELEGSHVPIAELAAPSIVEKRQSLSTIEEMEREASDSASAGENASVGSSAFEISPSEQESSSRAASPQRTLSQTPSPRAVSPQSTVSPVHTSDGLPIPPEYLTKKLPEPPEMDVDAPERDEAG